MFPPFSFLFKSALTLALLARMGGATFAAEHWVYLDNKHLRLGINMDAGGSIGWLSPSRSSDNLINAFDHGRYVQQSYYGDKDGSDWNGKPWCYNPVQGGSWKGKPATVLESKEEEHAIYVQTRPRQWASGEDVPDMILEQWIRLEGRFAHLKYRMTYTGTTEHKARKHQELPAVFVDPKCHTLVFCDATQPAWTNAELIRKQPGPPGTKGNIFHTSEHWAAWVNEHDQGLGIYFPYTDMATSYIVTGTGIGNCSYVAPLQTWALQPGMIFEYETVLTIGSLEQIRSGFSKISAKETAAKPVAPKSAPTPQPEAPGTEKKANPEPKP